MRINFRRAFMMLIILGSIWNTDFFYAKEVSQSNINYELADESNNSFKVVIYNTTELNQALASYKQDSEAANIIVYYKDITAGSSSEYELTDQQMDDLLAKGQIEVELGDVVKDDTYRVYLQFDDQVFHQKQKDDILNTGMSEEELSGEYIHVGEEPYTRDVKTEKSATCDIEQMKKVAESGGIYDGGGCSYVVTNDTELPLVDTNIGTIENVNISFASGTVQDTNAILATANQGMIENVIITKPVISLVDNSSFGAIAGRNDGVILNSRVEDADIIADYSGTDSFVSACLVTVTNGTEGFIINDDEYETEKGDYTGSVEVTAGSHGYNEYVAETRFNYGYIIGTDALIDGTVRETTYFSQIAIINEATGTIANTMVRGYVESDKDKLNLDQTFTTKLYNSKPLYVYSGFVVANNRGTLEYQDDIYISNIEVVKTYNQAAGVLVAINDGVIDLEKNLYISDISGYENAMYNHFGVITAANNDIAQVLVHGNIDINGIDLSAINDRATYIGSLIGTNKHDVQIDGNITATDINILTDGYSGGLFGWSTDQVYPGGEGEEPDTFYIEVGGYIDIDNVTINGNGNYIGGVIGRGAINVLDYQNIADSNSTYSVVMQNSTINGGNNVGGIAGELFDLFFSNPTHKGWYLNNVIVNGATNVGGAIGSTYNVTSLDGEILTGVREINMNVKGTTNVGGVVGKNSKYDGLENLTIENSEISGNDSVGAITGVNSGTISGASVASDVKVTGGSRLGTLVGLNEGTIDHSFSSGNIYDTSGAIIDSNQNEYTNDYVGTLVGQQVNHASLKQSVYDGDSYSNSIYREVGVQESLENRANVVNMCVADEYADNPTMTIGDYNALISYDEESEVEGKCQEQEVDNGERRDNYIAEDDYVVTAGNDYEVCVFRYYTDKKNNPVAPFTPACEEAKAFPLPFPYKVSLSIWVGTEIYNLWYVDKPTSENYSIIQPQDGIVLDLYNPLALGFGDCWNRDVYPPQLKPYNSDDICLIANS